MSTEQESHCNICFDPDYPEYEGRKPMFCWDDSNTSKPCPNCNPDGGKTMPDINQDRINAVAERIAAVSNCLSEDCDTTKPCEVCYEEAEAAIAVADATRPKLEVTEEMNTRCRHALNHAADVFAGDCFSSEYAEALVTAVLYEAALKVTE